MAGMKKEMRKGRHVRKEKKKDICRNVWIIEGWK